MIDTHFLWATGIEDTFIPHTRSGLRALDEYELTQHYKLWKHDFDLVAETGVKYLRWGIPWYRVQPRPDQWDWAWTDTVSYTHLRAHETPEHLVCRLLLEKKK